MIQKMSQELFAPSESKATYVSVILPLALAKEYTYAVPADWIHLIQPGIRVEVQFGKNKLYSAIVYQILTEKPNQYAPKFIVSILDEAPVVTENQFKLWKWMAEYYCCSLGEVMNASLPSGLKLASETKIILSPVFDGNYAELSDKEYLIAEGLSIQNELTIDDIRKIVNQKSVYKLINSLLAKKIIYIHEELKQKYKPKTVACIRLQEPYRSNQELLRAAFEKLERATRQMETLMAFLHISKGKTDITRKELCAVAKVKTNITRALEKKGIFEIYKKEVSRLGSYDAPLMDSFTLSEQQKNALAGIYKHFETKNVVLLHGVTGSGKTRVFIELIEHAIQRGEQVLYLLPEITLTAQIIHRLQKVFGDDISVYHSRLNNAERVELWNSVINGKPVVLCARSGMFLPYRNLGLVIVDEEHDPSFKQVDPSPRYNARDMAVFMAHLHKAKVVLGTATPSIETYHNALSGKYGLVEMKKRFGGLKLPQILIVDMKAELKQKKMQSVFTSVLIRELKTTLGNGEQAILFQNRRGYAPTVICDTCGWVSQCIQCDVSLTYHKYSHNLRCHYCGHHTKMPVACPACGNQKLRTKGFGTEKIEDELKLVIPEVKVGRMDWDTVRTKNAHAQIIQNFEQQKINVLVGTQMVTKGLDFDNVGLVGVLSADHLLHFPDFRASERAFQLMTQVSGRAGRKKKQGKVVIQAFRTDHPVLAEVFSNDFSNFYRREILERKSFIYPPYYRLIKITLKHKKMDTLKKASEYLAKLTRDKLGKRVLGPTEPGIARVRSFYLMDLMIKLEKKRNVIDDAKKLVINGVNQMWKEKGLSGVRVNIDVDPY